MTDAALEHAEQLDTVTDPDAEMIDVWLSSDGRLRVLVPNELVMASSKKVVTSSALDDDTKLQRCGFCQESSIFKKAPTDEWHCSQCGAIEKTPTNRSTGTNPIVRSLPYGGSGKEAQTVDQLGVGKKEEGIPVGRGRVDRQTGIDLGQPSVGDSRHGAADRQIGIIDKGKIKKKVRETLQRQRDVDESADMLAIDG